MALHAPASFAQVRATTLDFGPGSEYEDYLRTLQVAGIAPLYPWSVRGFSPRELDVLIGADTSGPWRLAAAKERKRLATGPLTLGTIFNSAFPYGFNDGPVWAGRGFTVVLSGGVAARAGPVSLTIAPVAFSTANRAFPLLGNGETGTLAYNDPLFPRAIDRPQRFGDKSYSRGDPGASSVRFDTRMFSLGVSTANEWIGPATEYPFLLGTNAAGFPHLFAGTGSPLNVWLARVHARVSWGRLQQSAYSPVTGSARFIDNDQPGRDRLMSSATIVFLPRGLLGLELGVGRFFHVPFRARGLTAEFWRTPVQGLWFRDAIAKADPGHTNQLASLFFRWAFPRNGFEVYAERGYDDQFYDLRDFIQDIDHMRSYLVGVQKILRRRPTTMSVLRAELINHQLPTIARDRFEGAVYSHGTLRQGHTQRGQLLGAYPGVSAAAGSTLSWTRYDTGGRMSVYWRRIVRAERGDFHVRGVVDPKATDVIHAVGIDRTRVGRHLDVSTGFDLLQNFNRNFSDDTFNLNARATLRWRP